MVGGQIAFEAERLALAHIRVDSTEAYENAVRMATEISAHALGVERVGVWHLRGERELELTHLYTLSNRRHSTERKTLVLPEHSAYGVALHARRAIVADSSSSGRAGPRWPRSARISPSVPDAAPLACDVAEGESRTCRQTAAE